MYDKTPGQIIEYHRSMLADTVRTGRYREAIEAAVKPGDVVLDLGCGTGILAFFACRAGAARVYAVETGPVIEIARSVCRENALQDRVVFFNELSQRVQLPDRVDVVVTETLGNFGLDEGILGSVIDARRRFLMQGGEIIPRYLELFIAPVELPEAYGKTELWSDGLHGLDFSSARALAVNNVNWVELSSDSFLSDPATLARFELPSVERSDLQAEESFVIERSAMLHGIGGWFAAELSQGIHLSNKPPLEAPSWRQAFFPLERPVPVEAGDRVGVILRAGANGGLWRWQVRCNRRSGDEAEGRQIAAFDQSSLLGQLLSPAQLRRRGAGYVPSLSVDGQIRRFVLDRMDGQTPLGEIARALAEQYQSQFASWQEALAVVADLSQKYA